MVQTAEFPTQSEAVDSETLTPELMVLVDQLVPPPRRRTRVLGTLLLAAALGSLFLSPISNALRPPPRDLVTTGANNPAIFDEERGLFSVRGQVLARRHTTVQVVDLAIDAPGAELVELELEGSGASFERGPVELPFEISKENDLSTAIVLNYTAWLKPEACQTTSEWGVVTVTVQDAAGKQSQVETSPANYWGLSTIPRELRPLGADLLQVACEVLR